MLRINESRFSACYASPVFAKIVGSIFRFLPGGFRRGLVRLGQRRFTVTAGAFVFDEQGRILLMLDVPAARYEELRAVIARTHPEAMDGGTEATVPAFP